MDTGGPIRFVGGQEHNRILHIRSWMQIIQIPIKCERSVSFDFSEVPYEPDPIETLFYELREMRYGRVFFWEYHLLGDKTCEHSGHDGTMHPVSK